MTIKKQKWETAKSRDENWAKNIPWARDPITNKPLKPDAPLPPLGSDVWGKKNKNDDSDGLA